MLDVNWDGEVSALNALLVINLLSSVAIVESVAVDASLPPIGQIDVDEDETIEAALDEVFAGTTLFEDIPISLLPPT